MVKPILKRIYEEMSEELNIPKDVIKNIATSQFEYTRNVIQEENTDKIYLKFLGSFNVKPGNLKRYEERKALRK